MLSISIPLLVGAGAYHWAQLVSPAWFLLAGLLILLEHQSSRDSDPPGVPSTHPRVNALKCLLMEDS